MRVLRIDLEYDGTDFRGFAPQPGARTVGGELDAVLSRVLGEAIRVTSGARTDSNPSCPGRSAARDGPPRAIDRLAPRSCPPGGSHLQYRGGRFPAPYGADDRRIEHTGRAGEACTDGDSRHVVRGGAGGR